MPCFRTFLLYALALAIALEVQTKNIRPLVSLLYVLIQCMLGVNNRVDSDRAKLFETHFVKDLCTLSLCENYTRLSKKFKCGVNIRRKADAFFTLFTFPKIISS